MAKNGNPRVQKKMSGLDKRVFGQLASKAPFMFIKHPDNPAPM
jgi:hypothetical protein